MNNFCRSGTLRVFKASQRPPVAADLPTGSRWAPARQHVDGLFQEPRERDVSGVLMDPGGSVSSDLGR